MMVMSLIEDRGKVREDLPWVLIPQQTASRCSSTS